MKKRALWFLILQFLISPLLLIAQEDPLPPGLYARFDTEKGELLFDLAFEKLPRTVSNFVALAEGKMNLENPSGPYYDNQKFYNLITGYALFFGDPQGTGEGGVDYTIPREKGSPFSAGTPGALVMTSRQGIDSGSQIMIMINGDSFLDQKYTTFGKLQKGTEILSKLKRGDTVNSVKIIRVGSSAQSFKPDAASVEAMIEEAKLEARKAFAEENPAVAAVLERLGDVKETETGIFYKITTPGSGPKPRPGNTVRMHYSGRLITGQEFDSSYSRGEPFQFVIGKDGVIPGWIETALSMQAGEKRTIILPPSLAYGAKGYGPIPPNSWLIFDIELLDFQ